jgi:AbiV family abortive infection protein
MKKLVKIPNNRIDYGIQASLTNAKRINKLASKLRKNDTYLALVLYYYAIEEFGKALYLEKSKKKSHNHGFIEIKLYDHKTKLDYVKRYHKDLLIKKLKFIKTKTEINPYKLIKKIESGYYKETRQNIFPSSLERTGYWLVDYNEKTKHWNEYKSNFIDDENLIKKISILNKKIQKMKKSI